MNGNVSARSSTGTEEVHAERELARRRARVRLLRDLVEHGLYRVDSQALAERLIDELGLEDRSG